MTFLEELIEEKNHRILIEKLAFLLGHPNIMEYNDFILNQFVKIWKEKDFKNTQYGKYLFRRAEKFSKINLTED